jgi:sortase A
MPLTEKQRREQDPDRPGYAVFKRRPRIGLVILAILTPLVLYVAGSYLYDLGSYLSSASIFEESSDDPEEQASEETAVEEDTAGVDGEPVAPLPPEDPTLYLTVPRLGIQGHTVRNDRSEQALELGAIKLPSTGFPWEKGANTYIACHRLGFPATESYNQCLNLPSVQPGDEVFLADSEGTLYGYRVSEVFTVGPDDSWVIGPVEGRDVVTLQTCTESPDDWVTLGPKLLESGPGSGRLIVRADRIA